MKSFFAEYSKIIGLLLLGFVIIILLSTPSVLFAKTITTIDTELSHATGDATPVRAKMDFGSNEHVRAFPKQIGDWRGSDYNTAGIAESLGADVMLMRSYTNPKSFQPVFFLLMQSNNRSSFHPPTVCYPALGYTVEEESKETIPVQNVSWAEAPLLSTWEKQTGIFKGTISAKKILVSKESDGKVTERRVVLYFYVKESPMSNKVTMARASALVPTEGSYDELLNITKEFMGETIPYMFEMRKKEEPVLFILLSSGSIIGKVVIVLLFLAPLTLIFYTQIRKIKMLKRFQSFFG